MSPYKSFAVVGFGAVGAGFANAFIKDNRAHDLRVLTRSKDKPELKALAAEGISVVPVDYSSPQSITDALKGVDVVFSALRDSGLDIQTKVIQAAKAAGVKLFVPSEYGRNTIGDTSEYLKVKADAHTFLKELSLPYTLFFTGMWPEVMFENSVGRYVGIDLEGGKFTLFGDGSKPLSWTSPDDFIPFVYRIVTTLPASKLENKEFEIEGDRKSFRDLIALWEKKHGRPAEIHERSDEEIRQWVDLQTQPMFRFLPVAWKTGDILVSGKDNKLWPEWKPTTWEDLMR